MVKFNQKMVNYLNVNKLQQQYESRRKSIQHILRIKRK